MSYQQVIPCSGWQYRHTNDGTPDSVYPVAAWAILDTGEVVGLISASIAKTASGVAVLTTPPPVGGIYEPV